MKPDAIREPEQEIPIVDDVDVCVIGGSTTGVFAAVAAARRACRVALVESLGFFGGTATASLVNVWHPRYDTAGAREIIGGLPIETMDRLRRRDAVLDRGNVSAWQYAFSPAELTCELDAWMCEHPRIRPFLHARFCRALLDGPNRVGAAVIEDQTGRRAIRARVFVDASGDAVLLHRAGFETYRRAVIQPPTTCLIAAGLDGDLDALRRRIFDPATPGALRPGFLWAAPIPGTAGRPARADRRTRVPARSGAPPTDRSGSASGRSVRRRDRQRELSGGRSSRRRRRHRLPLPRRARTRRAGRRADRGAALGAGGRATRHVLSDSVPLAGPPGRGQCIGGRALSPRKWDRRPGSPPRCPIEQTPTSGGWTPPASAGRLPNRAPW